MTAFSASDEQIRALGFNRGVADSTDLPTTEIRTRVVEWRIGYVVGRSFNEAVREGSISEFAVTAGRLGAQYGIDADQLLDALSLSDGQREVVRHSYTTFRASPQCNADSTVLPH